MRDEGRLLLHPVRPGQRAAGGRGQHLQARHLVGAVEGVDGHHEEVGEQAHHRHDQGDHEGGDPPLRPERVEHLGPHPDEHQRGDGRHAHGRRRARRPGQPVEITERDPAGVVLVAAQPVAGEGEEPVAQRGHHGGEQHGEGQVRRQRAGPVDVGDPGEEVQQQAEIDHQDQLGDVADPPRQAPVLA